MRISLSSSKNFPVLVPTQETLNLNVAPIHKLPRPFESMSYWKTFLINIRQGEDRKCRHYLKQISVKWSPIRVWPCPFCVCRVTRVTETRWGMETWRHPDLTAVQYPGHTRPPVSRMSDPGNDPHCSGHDTLGNGDTRLALTQAVTTPSAWCSGGTPQLRPNKVHWNI